MMQKHLTLCPLALLACLTLSPLAPSRPVQADDTAPAVPKGTDPAQAPDAGGNSPGESREARRERLLKNYTEVLHDLTSTQKEKILAVLEPASDAMKAVRLDPKLNPSAKREAHFKIHADVVKAIDPLLTPEQLKLWDAARKARTMQRREKAEVAARDAKNP